MINSVPNEAIERLVSKIAVMKPASIDFENVKEVLKLEKLFTSDDYIADEKIDGCHYMMVACRFFSTDHIEKTENYPHLRDFFIKLDMPNLILDGEIYYPGRTSQYCTRVTGSDPSTAVSFQNKNGLIKYALHDMIRTPKGTWLINKPWCERRPIVEYFYEKYIKGTPMEQHIILTKWVDKDKKQYADSIIADGGEGVILKKKNSLYVMGKKPAWMWVKYKLKDEADLIITGYEPSKIEYTGSNYDNWPYWKEVNGVVKPVTKNYYMGWIGALELSSYVEGHLTKICTCSGFDETLRKEFSENGEKYLNKVVKVTYMQKTEAGYPRSPRFDCFHESKIFNECVWEFNQE